jgi:hypothetical protein
MAKQVQLRRGTTAELSSVTGAEGEVIVDTTKDTLTLHDAYTAGGIPMLREDLDNLANNSVNIGKIDGTTAAAGQVIKQNSAGTGLEFGTAGLQSMQVFTSSGTWTKPAGINKIKVYVTGAGGGGGGGEPNWNNGGGGGGGGTAIEIIDVSAVSSVSVTVGTGGSGGAAQTNGSAGGSSSFGSYCSATGGGGGRFANGAGYTYVLGTGGTATGGNLNIRGGEGGSTGGGNAADEPNSGGKGGASFWGDGGPAGQNINGTGRTAIVYGTGGGGGDDNNGSSYAGGSGMSGIVVVEEYA